MILPERRCRFANKFKNGTDKAELREVEASVACLGGQKLGKSRTRYGPLTLVADERDPQFAGNQGTLTNVIRD
jgi:hypothetical protein